jgi:hypothetical protein
MPVTSVALQTSISFAGGSEVLGLDYELGLLKITLRALKNDFRATVTFEECAAFRVMDERDLAEYWPACSSNRGWIFEIQGGGWLAQELGRPASLVAHMNPGLREYLVAGTDDCVSIMAVELPKIALLPAPASEA